MNVAEIATTRRTCKAFDSSRKIPAEVVEELRTVLRFAPSSVNSQPWHYLIAATDAGRARIAETLQGRFAYNAPKVLNASHVVVLCARTDLDETHLNALIGQENADGRFATPEAMETQKNARGYYVDLHRSQLNDLATWIDRQVYIALGTLMFAAAAKGVDTCPMEGIDAAALDQALGLREKGLRVVVLCALGYSGADDFNARLPKSRLEDELVLSDL